MSRPGIHIVGLMLVAAALAPRGARAQDAGAFARQGFGPEGIAMGNAVSAVPGASPFYNPALAPFTPAQRLDASVASLAFDRSVQTVQFATPQRSAGFAVGLLRAAVTDIDGRDNAGFHTRTLSVDEFAGYLAFGLRFGSRVTGGLSLQAFRSDLYDGLDPVSTIGIDLGVTVAVARDVRVALVLDDLLARYDWDTSSLYGTGGRSSRDNFPRRIRIGTAVTPLDGLLLVAAEYEARFSSVETISRRVDVFGTRPIETLEQDRIRVRDGLLRVGIEVSPDVPVRFRAGVDRIGSGSVRPAAGLSIDQPVGTLLARFTYTYAREPWGLGSAHFAGLQLTLRRQP